jgi:hypothetical protein
MRVVDLYRRLFGAMWRALGADEVKPLLSLVLLIALVGATAFRTLEGWSFIDGFYFAIVTMATVGYGDIAPETPLGKAAAIVFMFTGIGVFVLAISTFAQAFLREIALTHDVALRPDVSNPTSTRMPTRIPDQPSRQRDQRDGNHAEEG